MAQQGLDWSTKTLRNTLLGRWVRIGGWLMFDGEHKQNAKTPHRVRSHLASNSVGVHPITSIQVLARETTVNFSSAGTVKRNASQTQEQQAELIAFLDSL